MATAVVGSRPLVGSSRNRTLGLCSTARARTRRWVWPLESFPAGLFLCSASPTWASTCSTLSRGTFHILANTARFCHTVIFL